MAVILAKERQQSSAQSTHQMVKQEHPTKTDKKKFVFDDQLERGKTEII
jgi:hypothetical protein